MHADHPPPDNVRRRRSDAFINANRPPTDFIVCNLQLFSANILGYRPPPKWIVFCEKAEIKSVTEFFTSVCGLAIVQEIVCADLRH